MSKNTRTARFTTSLFLWAVTGFFPPASFAATDSYDRAAPGKIALSVLYAGHPGSAREKDFVSFLDRHFKKVGTTALKTFAEAEAKGFDVVIMDYDGRCTRAPRPKLSRGYTRATVSVAGVGALIGSSLHLKAGYT